MRTAVDGNAMGLAAAKMAVVQETIHRHRHTRLLVGCVPPLVRLCFVYCPGGTHPPRQKKKVYPPEKKLYHIGFDDINLYYKV
jgi:hypothetical protein